MSNKSPPRLFYFIPLYGIYRVIIRIRALEASLQELKGEINELKVKIDGNKQEQEIYYRNVQFYEARIDGIYHKIMDSFLIDPKDARIGTNNVKD